MELATEVSKLTGNALITSSAVSISDSLTEPKLSRLFSDAVMSASSKRLLAKELMAAGPDTAPLGQLIGPEGALLRDLKIKNRAWKRTMVLAEWERNGRREGVRFHFDRSQEPWRVADWYFVHFM